jgi:hypothetical protein
MSVHSQVKQAYYHNVHNIDLTVSVIKLKYGGHVIAVKKKSKAIPVTGHEGP